MLNPCSVFSWCVKPKNGFSMIKVGGIAGNLGSKWTKWLNMSQHAENVQNDSKSKNSPGRKYGRSLEYD